MNDLEQEFLKLVDEYRSLLYKVCLMYESEWQTHEDLMQDVIVNLWRAYPTFRKEVKVSTWIYRVALNTCISQFRKRQSRPDTMPLKYNFDILADDDEDAKARVKELYRMIGMLAPMEKAVIMLWLDEKSYDEIAQVLGITPSNVGARMTRIRAKLKQLSVNS